MDIRGAFKALFSGAKPSQEAATWREIGSYMSMFAPYNSNLYANEVCRACIRTLSEHTSKANPKVLGGYEKLARMMQFRPNLYMNGKEFLNKVRNLYEINNTVFIYINRDDRGNVLSLYPMPSCPAEAVESGGRLYIRFQLAGGKLTAAWDDLAVIRKDYNSSDIFGDSNTAIATSLELLDTTSQGMANAIKSTANLRGILKSTKAMLSDDDVKKQRDRFVTDYMAMTNTSGIAMTDATLTFTPIQLQPAMANYKSVEDLRMNIYRYFGVSEEAILGKLHGDAWEAFYDASIEPFLIALGQELTYKIFTERERGFGNEIIFESNRLQYLSMAQKLEMVQYIDRGIMVPNELRAILNLAPIDGGDVPIRRLDTAPTNQVAESQKDKETKEPDKEPEKEDEEDAGEN